MNLIHDLVNPETGKTYKQENLERQHLYPVGTLVELESGVRLFVAIHTRDCDGTPLYRLSVNKDHDLYQYNIGNYPEEYLQSVVTEENTD